MKRSITRVTLWGTLIRVQAAFLGNVMGLWAISSWLGRRKHPERPLWACLSVGLAAVVTLLVADLGHAIAHILSARHAGAPMDEILISSGMPRTLYPDQAVSPAVHRKRALGGPIFSAIGCLQSGLVHALSTSERVKELASWSLLGHGFILMGSLLPFPMVDGGSILKWTLVERGRTPTQADEIVRRVNWTLGVLASTIGAALLALRSWVAGLIGIGVGGIALGVASDRIK
jgi:hypothetical protein